MIRGSVLLLLAWVPGAAAYEGFGAVTTGAAACPSGPPTTYTVTSLANSGAGTFRDAVSANCRNIVFGMAGTITLTADLLIQRSYLTIDGSSAPSPGITVSAPGRRLALEASSSLGPITDVIIHHLRLQGSGNPLESTDLLELDGQANPVSRIIIDHNTFIGSGDGNVDIWAEVRDVTVSWNLFMDSIQGQHFSNVTPPNRERISLHHNVYARINERQTRMRYDNRQVDFVNNVVYGWAWFEAGGAGMTLPSDPGYQPSLNVEDNYYHFVAGLPGGGDGDDALEFDRASFPGSVYFDGNVWPAAENDAVSTSARIPIPPYAEVTHFAASTLGNTVVPCVGTAFPTAAETTLLRQVSLAIGGAGGACASSLPTLSISDSSVLEGNAGTTTANFTVSLSAASSLPVTVSFTTGGGTASAGTDYQAVSGTLTFPAGTTSRPIAVTVLGDRVWEASETFLLTLSGATNATILDGQGEATIVNDDATGLSIGDVSVVERASGSASAAFTVTLSPASGSTVSVGYATADGTAQAPGDYLAASGTLTFAPGTTSRPVSITVNADAATEGMETFFVDLSNASGAPIAFSRGTGRIFDPGNFFAITPCRLVDTRLPNGPSGGPALVPGAARRFTLIAACGLPASAQAVSVNVAVTQPTATGHLRIFPGGTTAPLISSINYSAGQTRANNAVVRLGAAGDVAVGCYQAAGSVHFILDISGYYE